MPDIRRIIPDQTRSIRSSTSQKIKTLLTVLVSRDEYLLQACAANQTLIWNLLCANMLLLRIKTRMATSFALTVTRPRAMGPAAVRPHERENLTSEGTSLWR
jgi:hypothetical protein